MSIFSRSVIAATTAFSLSTAVAAQESPNEPVPPTALNVCVTTALQSQPGEFYSTRRWDEDGQFSDYFRVNASPTKDSSHMIGTYIVIDGTTAKGPQTIMIRGLHDGTVENDNGLSAVDFAITGDATDVQKPMDSVMVNGDEPWSKPLVDPEQVRRGTIDILMNIRACMAAAPATP